MNRELDHYGLTVTYDDRMIRSTLNLGGHIIQQVMDTQDRAIRDALLAMGWTPPGADIAGDPEDGTDDTSRSPGGGRRRIRAVVECYAPDRISEKKLVQKLRQILQYPLQLDFPGQKDSRVRAVVKSYERVRTAEKRAEMRWDSDE